MSSPVTTFQTMGMTAQTAVAAAVCVADAPIELQALPAGTVLPAVITPPEKPTGLPTISVSLPNGEQISFNVKLPHTPAAEMPVSLKILPEEIKNVLSFKIQFSAPLPDLQQAAIGLEETVQRQTADSLPSSFEPIRTQAFVLRSVPEQITALIPDLNEPISLPVLPADSKINIELTPDQNAMPALGQQEKPVFEPNVQNTPMPQAPHDETGKIISLPKDQPQTSNTPIFQNTPVLQQSEESSVFFKTETPSSQPSPVASGAIPPEETPQNNPVIMKQETALSAKTSFIQEHSAPVKTEKESVFLTKEQTLFSTVKEKLQPFVSTVKASVATPPDIFGKVPLPDMKEDVPFAKRVPEKAQDFSYPTIKGMTVSASGNEKTTLIATKIGVLAIEDPVRLPPLTPVKIQVVSVLPPETEVLSSRKDFPEFKTTWTILQNALETLKQSDPNAFEAVKNILPQVGNKLPALMLSFMNAAVQGATFSSFIGEANVSALRSTPQGERLLKRLEKEFSSSPKKATDGQNSWKGWDIPFLTGSVVEPVSLYLQRPSDSDLSKKTAQNNQHGIRFVLDLNLTKLGKLQMEGLARRTERRFDLIVRHQNDLPSFFDDDIQRIFIQTLSALNYTGTVKVDRTDDFISFTAEEENNDIKRGVLV